MPTTGLKRACDKCFSLKEKCRRQDQSQICERCARLRHTCQTTRSPARRGRKPKLSRKVQYTLPTPAWLAVNQSPLKQSALSSQGLSYNGRLASNTVVFSDLDRWERHFLNLMKDIMAPSPLDKYLIGPSFHKFHHMSFVSRLVQPTPILRDAAVACAAVLFGDQLAEYAKQSMEIGHKRAASVVSALRSFSITSEQDLVDALILGVSMVTFAMHVQGGNAYLISHYTLSLIKTQNTDLSALDPTTIDLLMCLITTETFECLLRSYKPTIRIDLQGREDRVDRYVGLCAPMFAHFYDICEISNSIRCSEATTPEMLRRLEIVQDSVCHWQPSTPVDFLERYTQAEVVSMLAQARILRLTAMLIIHRMYHPYGQNDKEGHMLSRAIISEFEMVLQLSRRSIPCTAIAYFVACFEMSGIEERSRAMKRSEDVITFSKQAQLNFKTIVNLIWNAKDHGYELHWFQIDDYIGT